MRLLALAVALMSAFAIAGLAIGQEFRPLAGRYALTTSNMVDSIPGEKPDRVIVFVEGKAAEDIFKGMAQKPTKDRCASDIVSKMAGNLVCSKLDAGKFFCSFGVSLHDGRILNGRTC